MLINPCCAFSFNADPIEVPDDIPGCCAGVPAASPAPARADRGALAAMTALLAAVTVRAISVKPCCAGCGVTVAVCVPRPAHRQKPHRVFNLLLHQVMESDAVFPLRCLRELVGLRRPVPLRHVGWDLRGRRLGVRVRAVQGLVKEHAEERTVNTLADAIIGEISKRERVELLLLVGRSKAVEKPRRHDELLPRQIVGEALDERRQLVHAACADASWKPVPPIKSTSEEEANGSRNCRSAPYACPCASSANVAPAMARALINSRSNDALTRIGVTLRPVSLRAPCSALRSAAPPAAPAAGPSRSTSGRAGPCGSSDARSERPGPGCMRRATVWGRRAASRSMLSRRRRRWRRSHRQGLALCPEPTRIGITCSPLFFDHIQRLATRLADAAGLRVHGKTNTVEPRRFEIVPNLLEGGGHPAVGKGGGLAPEMPRRPPMSRRT